ncbi:hypothetical protein TNCV_932941 [Trichonephila clavipes]|nr:hypothetical protein TNCV_932941 [Trichonephila clavipes]
MRVNLVPLSMIVSLINGIAAVRPTDKRVLLRRSCRCCFAIMPEGLQDLTDCHCKRWEYPGHRLGDVNRDAVAFRIPSTHGVFCGPRQQLGRGRAKNQAVVAEEKYGGESLDRRQSSPPKWVNGAKRSRQASG